MEPTWEREGIKLYLGDCLEVLPHLPKVDAVVTDPPYGVSKSQAGIRKQMGWRCATNYEGCFSDTPEYISESVVPAVEHCIGICASVAVTPGFKCMNLYPRPDHIGGFYYQGQSTVTAWGAAWWQPILFYGRDPLVGRLQRDMFIGKSNQAGQDFGHPCPKELSTWTNLVERMSLKTHQILDPFMGSGTTGVACVKLGRKFIGIEKEPKYFEIAVKRIERALSEERSSLFRNKDDRVSATEKSKDLFTGADE